MATKLIRTNEEAIDCLIKNKPTSGYQMLQESVDMAIEALKNKEGEKQIKNEHNSQKPTHSNHRDMWIRQKIKT